MPLQVAIYDAWAAYNSDVRAVYFKGDKVKATKVCFWPPLTAAQACAQCLHL